MDTQYDEQEAQTQREAWAVDDALMAGPLESAAVSKGRSREEVAYARECDRRNRRNGTLPPGWERGARYNAAGMTSTLDFFWHNFRVLSARALTDGDVVHGLDDPDEQIQGWRVQVNEDWANAVHLRGKHQFTVIKRSEIIPVAGKVTNMNAILGC